MTNHIITREHSFCSAHRICGHEGKCAFIHGHNYKVEFHIKGGYFLDKVGRIVDFSVIKDTLCKWVDENFDHKFLIYKRDSPLIAFYEAGLKALDIGIFNEEKNIFSDAYTMLPFNVTAENLAKYLVEEVGPKVFNNEDYYLFACRIYETEKCSAYYEKERD